MTNQSTQTDDSLTSQNDIQGGHKKRNMVEDDFFAFNENPIKKKKKKSKRHEKYHDNSDNGLMNSPVLIGESGPSSDKILSSDFNDFGGIEGETFKKEKDLSRDGSENVNNNNDDDGNDDNNNSNSNDKNNNNNNNNDDDDEDLVILEENHSQQIDGNNEPNFEAKNIITIDLENTNSPVPELSNEDNDDDDELEKVFKSASMLQSREENNGYQFTESNEADRLYLLRVKPKVHTDVVIDFTIKGTKEFEKVIRSVDHHYRSKGYFPYHSLPTDISLFWVEGRREIKGFYTPSTLRIQPPKPLELEYVNEVGHTKITCLLIKKEDVSQALTLYDELSNGIIKDDEQEQNNQLTNTESDQEFDDSIYKENEGIDDIIATDGKSSFKVGLKGQDNKRIDVLVLKETKIQKLLLYYLKTKNLDTTLKPNMKLIFDDEPLDLDDVIGNTELEDDFEVQVIL